MLLPTLLLFSTAPVAETTPELEVQTCATADADRSATLDSAQPFREKASPGTGGTAYAAKTGKCKRFIADFNVPSNAMPPQQYYDVFKLGVRTTKELGKTQCKNAVLWVTTFEKAAGASGFAKKTEAKYTGEWLDSHDMCDFGMNAPPLPSDKTDPAGTEVWRVAARATVSGKPVGITARIGFVFKSPK